MRSLYFLRGPKNSDDFLRRRKTDPAGWPGSRQGSQQRLFEAVCLPSYHDSAFATSRLLPAIPGLGVSRFVLIFLFVIRICNRILLRFRHETMVPGGPRKS